ncbi:MAG: response regulator [Myxococcales bacterium]|nr:response regulator [Myxococcales bacterium]
MRHDRSGVDPGDRLKAFEDKLAALKHRMESGLVERAGSLRQLADRLDGGDEEARRELKTESHKLRGIAGTYGHEQLTDLAAELEQRASMSPPATVGRLARSLADLAERTGHASSPPALRASLPPEVATPGPFKEAPLPAIERPGGGALRVLAIDDDPVTQRLLKLTLREVGGFQADIVTSAEEGLERLAAISYDVVVSDAMMPDMNGRELCERARAAGAQMPIVILSAASADELGWEGKLPGKSVWLRKPFKPRALVEELARVAGARSPRES